MSDPVRTTCPYCGVGCGVLAYGDGTVKGDPDHPANYGRLCSKGTQLGETIGPEGRLLTPQVHGKPASWNDAVDLVAAKFKAAIRDHGPESVAFYVSGQLLTEDYYVANKLMKGYIGSANIDTNSRLCMASSVAGHKRAFGTDTVPGCYEDFEQADLVVLVGSNLAWCHPVLFQRLVAAKQKRPGLRIVNIDPRRTATSDLADTHLSVAPDGDVALFNALLVRLVEGGFVDTDYVAAHVNGFDAAVVAARAAGDCGLSRDEIDAFTALWAGTEKVVTIYSQGVNQSECGTDKVNAILNCHLATGRIGRPGTGPFSVTGQPNAMGGREVGGLANMLANHLDIENPDHRAAVQSAWGSPTICTQPGLKAVDLFQACADGKIKALWVMSTNPAVSMPDADAVTRAIAAVPFVVCSDILTRTDTGDLADVLLPAAPWGEKSGTVTNSERRISRQRAFLPASGKARPDWKIISDVAARMGWPEAFDYTSEADIFREYAKLSELGQKYGRDFDISGLSGLDDAAYRALAPVQWPVSKSGAQRQRFFADGVFFHSDRRARMVATPARPLAKPPEAFPFTLNTGRVRDHWHTMTRTGLSAKLSQHTGEPFVEIHPDDARQIGVTDAELAQVKTTTGQATLRVCISKAARPGSIFVPMHWTRQNAPAGRVGPLVAPTCDPISGQPASKSSFADVRRYSARWFGFIASTDPILPTTSYFATRRTQTGWSAELAGETPPDDWAVFFQSLLGRAECQVVSVCDAHRGSVKMAAYDQGTVAALFFAAPQPVEIARNYVISGIGTSIPAALLLPGRVAAGGIDPGATLCSCMGVGLNVIKKAIANGASDIETIGEITGAGTNCGSCIPELTGLFEKTRPKVAAE